MSGAWFLPLVILSGTSAFTPSNYTHNVEIFPGTLSIYWTIDGDSINLALQLKQAEGWVGMGLSDPVSGSMPGSDVVVGYFDGTIPTIKDMHTVAFSYPIQDTCQDWELISSERATETVFEIRRLLSTPDSDAGVQDRAFSTSGDTRLIFAYGSSASLGYHGNSRKAMKINFSDPTPVDALAALKADTSVSTFDVLNDHSITAADTEYYNMLMDIPAEHLDGGILAFEPVLSASTEPYVHHVVLSGCDDSTCDGKSVIAAWARGIGPIVMPPQCVFMTGADGWSKLHLQTHYDNPAGSGTGKLDSSGLRVYVKQGTLPAACGVLQLGDPGVALASTSDRQSIAAGIQSWEFVCPETTTSALNNVVLNVFGSFLHMHAVGRQIYTKLYRGGQEIEFSRNDYYDWKFENTVDLSAKALTIQANDRLETTCVYDSDGVNWGLASNDEMCMEFVYYYPRIAVSSCGDFDAAQPTPQGYDVKAFEAAPQATCTVATPTAASPSTAPSGSVPSAPTTASPTGLSSHASPSRGSCAFALAVSVLAGLLSC